MASATVASSPTAAISRSQSSSTLMRTSRNRRSETDFLQTELTHYDRGTWEVKKNRGSRSTISFVPENLAVLHDKTHVLQEPDVLQGIAADRDDIRVGSGCNGAELTFLVEHDSRARSCALDCVHGRHSELNHAREFLRDRFGPGNSSHVSAEHNLDT